jgi:outer membrane protein W
LDRINFRALKLLPILIILLLPGLSGAVEKQSADRRLDAQYSMAGLRLGFWADMANTEPVDDGSIEADLPDAGFYTELYFDYRLAKPLFLELSMGIASRGDIVVRDGDDNYIGTLNLYPIAMQLKFSPLEGKTTSIHPYVVAGGGVVFGRQTIDIISFGPDPFYNPDIITKTETDFIGVVGGGIDFALSEQLGLNIAAKYYPIKFGDSLAGIREYSGMSIAVGVSYFLYKL